MTTNKYQTYANREEFLDLVRAGQFPGHDARMLVHGVSVDWKEIYRLAEEQSVMGLIADSIDRVEILTFGYSGSRKTRMLPLVHG